MNFECPKTVDQILELIRSQEIQSHSELEDVLSYSNLGIKEKQDILEEFFKFKLDSYQEKRDYKRIERTICVNGENWLQVEWYLLVTPQQTPLSSIFHYRIEERILNNIGDLEYLARYGDNAQVVSESGVRPNGFTLGECPLKAKEAEILVVRLDGSKSGLSIPRNEGDQFSSDDVGNSFMLDGEYLAYSLEWLGETESDAVLNWNDLTYRAGLGIGSAGYAHESLPSLSETEQVIHTSPIFLEAQEGAFIEFRFKKIVSDA